jgi:hypothetical protein
MLLLSTLVLAVALMRWSLLRTWLFDPYRPELHYMRGPGPKWREKHGQSSLSPSQSSASAASLS